MKDVYTDKVHVDIYLLCNAQNRVKASLIHYSILIFFNVNKAMERDLFY